MDLNTSSSCLNNGGETTMPVEDTTLPDADVLFIDSNIRVVGIKTGVVITTL